MLEKKLKSKGFSLISGNPQKLTLPHPGDDTLGNHKEFLRSGSSLTYIPSGKARQKNSKDTIYRRAMCIPKCLFKGPDWDVLASGTCCMFIYVYAWLCHNGTTTCTQLVSRSHKNLQLWWLTDQVCTIMTIGQVQCTCTCTCVQHSRWSRKRNSRLYFGYTTCSQTLAMEYVLCSSNVKILLCRAIRLWIFFSDTESSKIPTIMQVSKCAWKNKSHIESTGISTPKLIDL